MHFADPTPLNMVLLDASNAAKAGPRMAARGRHQRPHDALQPVCMSGCPGATWMLLERAA